LLSLILELLSMRWPGLASLPPPLSHRHAAIHHGNSNGKLSLSIRSILELKLFLREEYGDEVLPDCALCLEMITVRREACGACGTLLHRYCLRRLQGVGSVQPKCPSCKQPWTAGRGDGGPAAAAMDVL
jgi:hypothetical protein